MIGTIALKEILVSVKTVRFIVAALVCCLLMPISVWVLSSDYLRDLDDYNGRLGLEERRVEGKNFKINVNRPIPSLSPLFRGVLPDSANSIELKFYIGWNYPLAAATQSITHGIFPSVDLAFVIGIVLSALALMLSFDAVSGEKADATLRLIMSNSMPRFKLIIGKWLGLSGALLIPFIVGIFISLLIFFAATGVTISGNDWLALTIAILAAIFYITLFILIGIVISAFFSTPSVSIFVCLGVWGILTLILPQVANATSEAISPIQSPQKIEKDIRIIYNQMAHAMREHNMGLYDEAQRTGMKFEEVNRLRNRNEMKLAKQNRSDANDIEREFWLEIDRQERLGRMLSYVSPYGCLNQVLVSMANTGPSGQREFLRQSYRFGERYYNDIWDERLFNANESTWAEIIGKQPKFQYVDISLEQRIESSTIPLALLVIFNIVLLIVGVIAYNRYDVR